MILTAGLTPAWQQILVFESLRLGQVNRAVEAHWCASGKVFNAGVAAHRLGGPSLTLAAVGGPPLEQIRAEMISIGVPCRFLETKSATRVCTTVLDRASGQITELVENGRPLSAAELEAFRVAYGDEVRKADVAVLMGTLPAETPNAFYRDLLCQTACQAVLDIRGRGLLACLDLKPYVIKPNREELATTMGRDLSSEKDLLAAMRELNQRGAQWVVITDGAGPVWLTSEKETHRLEPPKAERVVNPIGCGDALAAGIAWGARQGRGIVESVEIGLSAAAQNLAHLLPCREISKKCESEN